MRLFLFIGSIFFIFVLSAACSALVYSMSPEEMLEGVDAYTTDLRFLVIAQSRKDHRLTTWPLTEIRGKIASGEATCLLDFGNSENVEVGSFGKSKYRVVILNEKRQLIVLRSDGPFEYKYICDGGTINLVSRKMFGAMHLFGGVLLSIIITLALNKVIFLARGRWHHLQEPGTN